MIIARKLEINTLETGKKRIHRFVAFLSAQKIDLSNLRCSFSFGCLNVLINIYDSKRNVVYIYRNECHRKPFGHIDDDSEHFSEAIKLSSKKNLRILIQS